MDILKTRYLENYMLLDLNDEKMVFVGGPRQVGKTTLAVELLAKKLQPAGYLNWDNREDRRKISSSLWPGDAKLLILDELHKYKKWKNFIKGEYDKLKHVYKFILTGSARMDTFRRGGDSLQGRYHYYRLHPFSLAELNGFCASVIPFEELSFENLPQAYGIDLLEKFGGFPEPLFKAEERFIRRWHNEKIERMFREDIQEMAIVNDLASMKLLSDLLPSRVGSLLSTNALREDLEVSFKAAKRWLDLLESFYYCFRIYPYSTNALRVLKKEPKLYLWDWSEVADESARFENLIASHLLKLTHYLYDCEGYRAELQFLRDLDKREVDFLVTNDKKPWFAVEVKLQDCNPSKTLIRFKTKLEIPWCFQVVRRSGIDILANGIRIISADKFLTGLC
ncbi:MAG: ATP-binding protein [Deltaproteobacteria bacterium]|nr:ATP-binding protein [Deltaproteobacteria bacterium]